MMWMKRLRRMKTRRPTSKRLCRAACCLLAAVLALTGVLTALAGETDPAVETTAPVTDTPDGVKETEPVNDPSPTPTPTPAALDTPDEAPGSDSGNEPAAPTPTPTPAVPDAPGEVPETETDQETDRETEATPTPTPSAPDTPDEPSEPETGDDPAPTPTPTPSAPDTPDEPSEPETGDDPSPTPTATPATPDTQGEPSAPETGDDPSPTPSPSPVPQVTMVPLPRLTVTVDGAEEDEETHVWSLSLPVNGKLTVRWSMEQGLADRYTVVLTGSGQESREETEELVLALPTGEWPSGTYRLRVVAYQGEALIAGVTLVMDLTFYESTPTPKPTARVTPTPTPTAAAPTQTPAAGTPTPTAVTPTPAAPTPTPPPEDEPTPVPTETGTPAPSPSARPTWPPRGGSRRGGSSGKGSQAFVVTPGKALISTHASGTGDMSAYGTVTLTPDEDWMTILSLGGQALEVSRGGEEAFHAAVEEDLLVLTDADPDGSWYFTQYALQVLGRSGVSALSFSTADGEVLIPTDLELTGPAYGRERANGFVASDFVYSLTDEGLLVQVEDRLYAVHDGKLVAAAAE